MSHFDYRIVICVLTIQKVDWCKWREGKERNGKRIAFFLSCTRNLNFTSLSWWKRQIDEDKTHYARAARAERLSRAERAGLNNCFANWIYCSLLFTYTSELSLVNSALLFNYASREWTQPANCFDFKLNFKFVMENLLQCFVWIKKIGQFNHS